MLNDFAEKKRNLSLAIKNRIFQSPKKTHFFKGVNPCFWSKNARFLIYSGFVKMRVEKMLKLHWRVKRNVFDYKKRHFSKSKRSHFFKGVNPCFWAKNANFILNLNLIKISLEIMLSHFAEKKETFLTLKNRIFQSSKKRTFSKGLTHAFGQKMPFFNLFRFGQNKSRNNA